MITIDHLSNPKLIDPLTEPVIADQSTVERPLCIDLYRMFGARGLKFMIAVEDVEQLKAVLAPVRGKLFLFREPMADQQKKTRLAIRATDIEGDAVSTTITVDLGERVDLRVRAA